eukprot:gene21807-65475_t
MGTSSERNGAAVGGAVGGGGPPAAGAAGRGVVTDVTLPLNGATVGGEAGEMVAQTGRWWQASWMVAVRGDHMVGRREIPWAGPEPWTEWWM